ncbi:ABC transporter permease [Agaribacter marinus]|uniref:Transport permease protein n=1 Tax=Virgibacillus salarius TaxID=447199 RepID=A0A941DSH6_9BACI|nr:MULTISPECIES: ABC transporter permease [Bacillaceae]MBR7795790.1 ABC transporter permease [Virgibacillus salarius]NAZ08503.1 ABC transporter permease [Agaribacter marinus]WBX81947.1 ABC transporter permease [Virgibacillus salarius]
MKSAIKVIKEQIDNFYLIRRLSIYELKSQNKNNYLGMSWEAINPAIQILIYWFVFSTLRSREPIDMNGIEIPFFSWLIAAFFLWIFFYQSTIQGSKSIYTRIKILSKMNFPMSVIPSFVIFSQFYVHVFMLLISIIVLHFTGFTISIYYIQLLYFVFAALCLLFAISLITSTLSTIVRDFHMLLNSVLRMMLYLSGVLWPLTLLSDHQTLMSLMKLNPLYYLIEGYRASLFGTEWYFITNWEYTLYFWGLVIIILILGSTLHVKFRRHFIDYL